MFKLAKDIENSKGMPINIDMDLQFTDENINTVNPLYSKKMSQILVFSMNINKKNIDKNPININRSTNSQGIVETINTIVLKIIVLGVILTLRGFLRA